MTYEAPQEIFAFVSEGGRNFSKTSYRRFKLKKEKNGRYLN